MRSENLNEVIGKEVVSTVFSVFLYMYALPCIWLKTVLIGLTIRDERLGIYEEYLSSVPEKVEGDKIQKS